MARKQKVHYTPFAEFLDKKARTMGLPISGTFELSPLCNLECRMCYVRKTAQEMAAHPRKQMKMEDWLKLAQQVKSEGMLYLLLTGGEPFIWPDFWELYEELITMGFLISINSNGTMIDEKVVERLVKNPLTRINITLYGASDETYLALCGREKMFSRVDRAIKLLKAAGIGVKLNCALTPYNAHDLEKIIAYAQEQDLVLQVATYMFPPVRRDESLVGQNDRFTPEEAAKYQLELVRLQDEQEEYKQFLRGVVDNVISPPELAEGCVDPLTGEVLCAAGRSAFWVTWDGYVTPCGMMPEPKVDLHEADFASIWQKLKKLSDDMHLSGTCQSCENQKICHSCAAMAIAETGSPSGIPKYNCDMMLALKALAEEALAKA